MRFRLLLAALCLATAFPGPVAGQDLVAHHSFPLAGDELVIVVQGFAPGAALRIDLPVGLAPPPPSLQLRLLQSFELLLAGVDGKLSFAGWADARGELVLNVPLTDPGDPNHLALLHFEELEAGRELDLRLLVQPPMALLPVPGGLARVELMGGHRLLPDVPLQGRLMGAALSSDGLVLHTLLEGGRLQERSAYTWNRGALRERVIDAAAERLAGSRGGGPAFVIAREQGSPFAPPGRLVPLDGRLGVLQLDPVGRPMQGRRWALTNDGLTAFVAEDDLIVREIDLVGWRVRTPFSAGFNGDRVVSDLVLDDQRLLVASRRAGGQPGSLTALQLGSGLVRPWALGVDPLRIVVLEHGLSLALPARGALFQVLQQGVPSVVLPAGGVGEQLLDAAPVPGGALLLIGGLGPGPRLASWSPERGLEELVTTAEVLPGATRLMSAGRDLALMLGAEDGSVWRVIPSRGVAEPLEDLRLDGPAGQHQLP